MMGGAICTRAGTVKVPIVEGKIKEMVQCGRRIYWDVIDTNSRYYVDSDGRKLYRPPDCPGDVMKIYYIPAFLSPGVDDAALWTCDFKDLIPLRSTWSYFVTPIDIDLDAIVKIAAKLNLLSGLLHVVYYRLLARNTTLGEFCRRCAAGVEEGTSLAVCIVCRRLYGTEVAPTAYLMEQLEYKMRKWVMAWDRLADAIYTLTQEEFNELLDGIFAVVNGDFTKLPKRLLDIIDDVWERV